MARRRRHIGTWKNRYSTRSIENAPQSSGYFPISPIRRKSKTGCISDPRDWKLSTRQSSTDWMAQDPMCIPACWLGSRELMIKAGPWDESLLVNQDGEFFCRVIAESKEVLFDDSLRYFTAEKAVEYPGLLLKKRTHCGGALNQWNQLHLDSKFRAHEANDQQPNTAFYLHSLSSRKGYEKKSPIKTIHTARSDSRESKCGESLE